MKIELNQQEYVWIRKRKNSQLLDIHVSMDTEKIPPQITKRIKNAIQKGYYGSGSDSVIGTGVKEIIRLHNLPFIFCNRAYWTCGMTFLNVPDTNVEKVKEFTKNMSNIAGIKIENERYYGNEKKPGFERWGVRVEFEAHIKHHAPNALVRKEFAGILKGALNFYKRELLTKEEKEKLVAITKEF